MKASELIEELQKRIELYGDLSVVLWDIGITETSSRSHIRQVTADIVDGDGKSFIEIEFE